jgi:4a-hydroxytetrahydrobiopterin dehydratase
MAKLSESEIQARLPESKGWERLGDMLVRTWRFASAHRALEFVNRLADLARQREHYPDIVLSYRDVRVELATRTEGGLTSADFDLAAAIDQVPTD